MIEIGKLNIELYKCISQDIISDDIVLTDKQIEHIDKRRPGILSIYQDRFEAMINDPDYIIKDSNKNDTALVIKSIMDENYNNINIVLKLAVQKDSIYNKNSIITCIPISDKRLQTYKNSKQIVYKKVK